MAGRRNRPRIGFACDLFHASWSVGLVEFGAESPAKLVAHPTAGAAGDLTACSNIRRLVFPSAQTTKLRASSTGDDVGDGVSGGGRTWQPVHAGLSETQMGVVDKALNRPPGSGPLIMTGPPGTGKVRHVLKSPEENSDSPLFRHRPHYWWRSVCSTARPHRTAIRLRRLPGLAF